MMIKLQNAQLFYSETKMKTRNNHLVNMVYFKSSNILSSVERKTYMYQKYPHN